MSLAVDIHLLLAYLDYVGNLRHITESSSSPRLFHPTGIDECRL